MRKFLTSLKDADLAIIQNSFASSLGDNYAELTRDVLVERIVQYCKDYRIGVIDLKSRFFGR